MGTRSSKKTKLEIMEISSVNNNKIHYFYVILKIGKPLRVNEMQMPHLPFLEASVDTLSVCGFNLTHPLVGWYYIFTFLDKLH